MDNELAAIRAIEQRLYDILRGAPGTWQREVVVLSALQHEIDAILTAHGITPLTGPELERVDG